MSMGVFAVSYAATWTTSQDDQARYQVGAGMRVQTSRRTVRSGLGLGPAYRAIPGSPR